MRRLRTLPTPAPTVGVVPRELPDIAFEGALVSLKTFARDYSDAQVFSDDADTLDAETVAENAVYFVWDKIRPHFAAAPPVPPAVVPGWQLVPCRPDPIMLGAWYRQKNNGTQEPGQRDATKTSDDDAYRAMLASAPRPGEAK